MYDTNKQCGIVVICCTLSAKRNYTILHLNSLPIFQYERLIPKCKRVCVKLSRMLHVLPEST